MGANISSESRTRLDLTYVEKAIYVPTASSLPEKSAWHRNGSKAYRFLEVLCVLSSKWRQGNRYSGISEYFVQQGLRAFPNRRRVPPVRFAVFV